jgi:hypothetical protein
MKTWTKPEYQLIDMNAEIGSYQEDFGDERDPVGRAVAGAEGAVRPERESVTATASSSEQPGVSAGATSA